MSSIVYASQEGKLAEACSGAFAGLAAKARGLLHTIRRNHALEHATVHLLARRAPTLHVVGRTVARGFYLYGDVDTQSLRQAAEEALTELGREPELAVHPRCGTNLAITALVAGLAAFVAGSTRGRSRLATLPRVLMASLWGVLLAQPLGHIVQRELTTDPNVAGGRIGEIRRTQSGKMTAHFVPISWE